MAPVVLMFVLGVGLVLGGYAAATMLPGLIAQRQVDRRLREVSSPGEPPEGDSSLVMKSAEGPLPAVERILARTAAGGWLEKLIQQSGVQTSPSTILIIVLGLATLAALVTSMAAPTALVPVAAIAAGLVPFGFLLQRRSSRMHAFEEQFPEALDMMARALRAGHAFQTSMGMAAEEMHAPVGPEFKRTFDQQNYGLPLRDALTQLSERMPLLDVRFFVTAVLIQRETGGNLSEILENLGHVVRERFKIRRQVRVYTAHGRFTAFVLLSLPAALAIALMFINPEHMQLLFKERMGQTMLVGAMVMQAVGFVWIRKVIKIEV